MRIGLVLVVCVLSATATHAQWLNYPTPGVPRTKDGKVNLTAPMPKTADGKPDLSGVWHVQPTGLAEMKRLFGNDVDVVQVPGMEVDTISKYGISVFMDFKPGDEPMRKEAADLREQHQQRSNSGLDNLARCLPGSIPLATMLSEVTKIVQTPGLTLIMHESTTPRGKSTRMDALTRWIPTHRGSDIRLADGRRTRWSSRRSASTAKRHSTSWGIRAASRCGSRSDTSVAMSGTSMPRSRSTIR